MAQQQRIEINHSSEPIRLFQSDFLEFFTHITPLAIIIIWVPFIGYLLVRSVQALAAGTSWLAIPVGLAIGLAIWSLSEYLLHRFLFHYHAKTPKQERIFFLFHGVHHAQPQCKTRLVMPPVVSIPLAALFFGAFQLLVGDLLGARGWTWPLFAGFLIGYLFYDLIHYATHHLPMRRGWQKYLKRHHMQHHFKTPNQRFGVSSSFWDGVFGTLPAE